MSIRRLRADACHVMSLEHLTTRALMENVSVQLVALNPGRYSLALGYLISNLRSSAELRGRVDVDATLIDLDDPATCAPDPTELVQRITCYRPQVVGFSVFMWNHELVAKLAHLIAELHPEITLVLGGSEFERVSLVWDDFPDSTVIVVGEGEEPLVAIVGRLLEDRGLEGIPGVALKRDGEWRVGAPPRAHDLANLSSPILDGSLRMPDGDWFPSYSISRGCIYRCCYCSWGDGRGLRYFPIERVERELEILARRPYERMWFTDCLFGVDEDRYVWLLERLANWPHRTQFGFETRAEFLTPRVIEGLRRVALDFLAIGIQTLDRAVLRNVDRSHDEKSVFEALDRLVPAIRDKHRINLDLILGLPGDSVENAFATVDRLHARYPQTSFFIELLKVLPGTPLWDLARRDGWSFQGATDSYDLVRNQNFTEEQVTTLKALGEGLSCMQRPHIRPHLPKLSEGSSFASFAVAVGEYLRSNGFDRQHRFDGKDWLSNHLGIKTRRTLREILDQIAVQQ